MICNLIRIKNIVQFIVSTKKLTSLQGLTCRAFLTCVLVRAHSELLLLLNLRGGGKHWGGNTAFPWLLWISANTNKLVGQTAHAMRCTQRYLQYSCSACSVFVSEAVLVCRANHITVSLASEPLSAFWGKVFKGGGGNNILSWRQVLNTSSGTSVGQAFATFWVQTMGSLISRAVSPHTGLCRHHVF